MPTPVPYTAEKMDIPYVKANIPGKAIRIHHGIAKAESLLDYAPQFDIKSIDTALEIASQSYVQHCSLERIDP